MSRRSSPCNDHASQNILRLVVLGGGAVGKSALLKRFLHDEFTEKHRETVEDLHRKTYFINNQLIQADLLDTAGTCQFPAMRRLSISHADGILLVYSVNSASSFTDMKCIFDEIRSIRGESVDTDSRSLPIVMAANKCDLPKEKWEISRQQVDEFMLNETLDWHAAHLETSAKTGYNVQSVFETVVRLSPIVMRGHVINHVPRDRSASYQNGHTTVRMTSPVRRKQRPPPTQRRFSLQAFNLTSSSGQDQKSSSASSTPVLDSRKGSVPTAGSSTPKKNQTRSMLRSKQKTKSHEDLDVPECFVQ